MISGFQKQGILYTVGQPMKKLKQLSLLFILCTIIIFAVGCQGTQQSASEQKKFDAYMNEIFKSEVQSDSITLNYTLTYPENYGITDFKPTLGSYTLDSMKEGAAVTENYLANLKKFNYKQLSDDQKLTYDILKNYLTLDQDAADLLLYTESLGPTTGIQAQLPILLAEYNFNSKEDIVRYLELLPCVYNFFEDIVTMEQEKSKAGLFMNDTTADSIIEQCSAFISDPEDNYLIEIFNDRVDNFKGLTDGEKNAYKKTNKEAILNKVIPAYENLVNGLAALKGTGKNPGGLSGLPEGKRYYEYLVKSQTGSGKSIAKIDKLLDSTVNVCLLNMAKIAADDPAVFDKFDTYEYPLTDPEEIINYLKDKTKADFPDLTDVNCTIKYVHKSLEDHLSPAFYLTPPIDNVSRNNIYINGGKDFDLSQIFTTMAHEGYPGHLYQTVYFSQQQKSPIRYLLSFGGYSEGWATYVEMYSYSIAGLDASLADMLKNNMVATLCMYAKVDVGVNYHNWTTDDVAKYLQDFGINDPDDVQTLFDVMVAEPGNYLKYTLGYLEFTELRQEAEAALKDKFSPKEFHEFILSTGPCQFYILQDQMKDWIKTQR